MTLKPFIILTGVYVAFSVMFPSMKPAWFENPHKALLGVKQLQINGFTPKKPDLSQIKETVYEGFKITIGQDIYRGLISIKPDANGKPKIGGAVYLQPDTDKIGILESELIDKGDHYQVQFKSQPAAKLFSAKTAYQEKTDFPLKLEIHTHSGNGEIYITAPLKELEGLKAYFYSFPKDAEKNFVGKWTAHDINDGKWKFELTKLPNNQLNGFAYYEKNDERQCAYAVLGIPSESDHFIIMTGESSIPQSNCYVRSWRANAGTNHGTFDFYNKNEESLSATRDWE